MGKTEPPRSPNQSSQQGSPRFQAAKASKNSGRNSGFLKVYLLRESLDITAHLWTREERVDSCDGDITFD
jgi:hypothetical protein